MDTRHVPGLQAKGLAPVDVTLASVGGPGDLELFMDNAAEWEGPKVNNSGFHSFNGMGMYHARGITERNSNLHVTAFPRTMQNMCAAFYGT